MMKNYELLREHFRSSYLKNFKEGCEDAMKNGYQSDYKKGHGYTEGYKFGVELFMDILGFDEDA